MPLAHRSAALAVTGLIQRPDRARTAQSRRAYLFVNGRAFADRALVRAADRAYRSTIPQGVYPSIFLFLDVPHAEVDVNVHPAKAEVRFRDRVGVERLIEEAVRGALAGIDSTPTIGLRAEVSYAPVGPAPGLVREAEVPRAAEPSLSQMTLFLGGAPAAVAEAPDTGAVITPESPPVMWQVHNTYIIAETRSGLVLVDQHSAHERVLYEEIVRGFGTGMECQRLLFPLTLRLSPAEYALVEQITGLLQRAGFEVEPFGDRSVIVHAVPTPHPYFDAERCLREMIRELTEGSPLVDASRNQHERIALSMACKGAIKAGQKLSQREMSELFDRLFATELPYHDIHGRPTVVQLSLAELHRRFGRSG
jgi:DNA mismatch repair protein MutL